MREREGGREGEIETREDGEGNDRNGRTERKRKKEEERESGMRYKKRRKITRDKGLGSKANEI